MECILQIIKSKKECETLLNAYVCSSNESSCMKTYKHNTKIFECMLRNKIMTIDEYRKEFNPHYTINDKLYNKEIDINSAEFLTDRETRINNFVKFGYLDKDLV